MPRALGSVFLLTAWLWRVVVLHRLLCARRRCFPAHCSHRVCPSMDGSPQCLHRPRDLAFSSLSLNLVCFLSFLASGVSGIRFGLGSFVCFCFLVSLVLGAGFCSFFLGLRRPNWMVSTKSCLFGMLYPATTCPTRPRTQLWRPWHTWAVPGGGLRRSLRPKRATWGWTSTRPAPGLGGITTWPYACWLEPFS